MNDIHEVLKLAFSPFKTHYSQLAFKATVLTSTEIIQRMEEGPVWVATDGEHVVGTASVVVEQIGIYIRGMAIIPTQQGKGLAKLLMDTIIDFIISKRLNYTYLYTGSWLISAISLYKKYGFVLCAEKVNYEGTELLKMERYFIEKQAN